MTAMTIQEKSRNLKILTDVDVAVVGGGIAGAAAALAASRTGAKVCLLEKSCLLGGLATAGLVTCYLPLCDGRGRQVIGGIGEELLKLSVDDEVAPSTAMCIGRIPSCWLPGGNVNDRAQQRHMVDFNPVTYACKLEKLLRKSHVTLYYDMRFCDVHVQGDTIDALIVESKSGRTAIRCKTVVDASGDADVCVAAGERTVAPGGNVRCGWYYYADGDGKMHRRILTQPFSATKRFPENGRTFKGTRVEDVTAMCIASRELMLQDMARLKATEKQDIYPLAMPSIPCTRMSRHLQATVTLKSSDAQRWFEDAVGMTGDWRKAGPVYTVPLRALAARKTANLITAGRCISCSGDTWDVMRVIPTCAVTGEAAGTAAAFLAKDTEVSRFAKLDIAALQRHLKRHRVILDKSLLNPIL